MKKYNLYIPRNKEYANLNIDIVGYFCQLGLIIINKPAILQTHSILGNTSIKNLENYINKNLLINNKKVEKDFKSLYFLEHGISGLSLFFMNKMYFHKFKNYYGSELLEFKFIIISYNDNTLKNNFICNLPLKIHDNNIFVSHKYGKKSKTTFNKIKSYKSYNIWEATTNFIRLSQIYLHARESGINIFGKYIYNKIKNKKLNNLFKYHPLMIHLKSIKINVNELNVVINSNLPKLFCYYIKKIDKLLI